MLVPSDLRQPGGSEGGNPGLEDAEDVINRMNERKRGRRGEMDMILDPQRIDCIEYKGWIQRQKNKIKIKSKSETKLLLANFVISSHNKTNE